MKEQERIKYQRMWEVEDYRKNSPGQRLVFAHDPIFREMLAKGKTLIDFGAGSGRAATHLWAMGFDVTMVDITTNCLDRNVYSASVDWGRLRFLEACLWELPDFLTGADWILCTDVMEHIPEEYVDQVLNAIACRTIKGGVFNISNQEEGFGAGIGEILHLTVKPPEWWIPKLEARWDDVEILEGPPGSLTVMVGSGHGKK